MLAVDSLALLGWLAPLLLLSWVRLRVREGLVSGRFLSVGLGLHVLILLGFL